VAPSWNLTGRTEKNQKYPVCSTQVQYLGICGKASIEVHNFKTMSEIIMEFIHSSRSLS
jgi:hypothetical protein